MPTNSNTLTDRLISLLEYFQEPKSDMITYIEPNKLASTSTQAIDTAEHKHAPTETNAENVVSMQKSKEPPVTSTAIVQVGAESSTKHFNNDEVTKFNNSKYKPHEKHRFVDIKSTSFVSCSSPTGIYSEIVFILWVDNKTYVKYNSNDKYRIMLSLMYDSEEDLWCVSSKLVRRASYYSKDEEEHHISNRLCTSLELRSEVKKMLLFMGISPREAYRRFRRNVEEDFIVSNSEIGFKTVECISHNKLMQELEKNIYTQQSSVYNNWDYHGSEYGGYPHMRQETVIKRENGLGGRHHKSIHDYSGD